MPPWRKEGKHQNMNNETRIIAFERQLIRGFYHDDTISHLVLSFPKESKYHNYVWSISIDKIRYNTTSGNDSSGNFNDDKCWIEVDTEEKFKLFNLFNKEDEFKDVITVDVEEMIWRLKPKIPYYHPETDPAE